MVNLTVAYFSGYCSSVVCHSVSFHSRLLKYLNRIVSEEHSTTSFEVISALPLPWQNQFYQVRSISKLVQENSKYFRQYFKYGSLQYLSWWHNLCSNVILWDTFVDINCQMNHSMFIALFTIRPGFFILKCNRICRTGTRSHQILISWVHVLFSSQEKLLEKLVWSPKFAHSFSRIDVPKIIPKCYHLRQRL